MALQIADRVQVTATANTTVSFTLGSAVTGYQSFATAGITNGNTVFYGSSDGTNWEVGIGIYSSTGPTLTRSTILSSSNSGSAVSTFGSSVNVWIDYPSSQAVYNDPLNGVVTPSTSIFNNNIVDKQLYLQGGNNLLVQSQTFSNASWTKQYSSVSGSITAPDGTSTATQLIQDTTASVFHRLYIVAQVVIGTTYTFSVYVKANTMNFVQLNLNTAFGFYNSFDVSTGTIGTGNGSSPTMKSVGNGWYRCTITGTATSTGNGECNIVLVLNNTSGGFPTYNGDGTSGLYIWGAQIEAGTQASSYTPTTTAAITTTNNISVPSGSVAIGGTTNSTSNTTGALTVVGGIGSSSNIYSSGGATSSASPTTGGIWAYQPYPAFAGGFLNSPVVGFTASAWNSASGAVASQAYMQLNALTYNVNPPTAKLSFYIGANGASPTEKMYLSSAGALTTTADSTFNTVKVGLGGGNVSTNMAVGYQALNATATGGNNTGLGYQVLASLTGGVSNVAIGSSALLSNNNGNQNIGIGQATLYANTSGNQNTGVGHNAFRLNISGSNNIAIGYNSLWYNTTASANTAVGWQSLYNNTITGNLTAIGYGSLQNNTTNVATLGTITGGTGYTAGTYTGVVMTLSSGSTATTYPTATIVVSGGAVTSVTLTSNGVGFIDTTTVLTAPAASIGGTGSGFSVPVASLASGTGNTAIGYQALTNNTIGGSNSSLGYYALGSNTTGNENTAVGNLSSNSNTTGSNNVSVGSYSLYSNSTGGRNNGLGRGTLYGNTTGSSNQAMGYSALYSNTIGSNNVALGDYTLQINTTASNLTAVGHNALLNNTTNVATLGSISAGGTGYNGGASGGPLTVQASLSSGSTATTYPTLAITVTSGVITAATLVTNGVGFKDITTVLTVTSAAMVTAGFSAGGSGFTIPVASLASGSGNTAVGYQALTTNSVGGSNTSLGYQASNSNTTGSNNTSSGYQALFQTTTGVNNTAVGSGAMYRQVAGGNCTAVGYNALYTCAINNNTGIGSNAGYALNSGQFNTLIGQNAGYSGTNNLSTGASNTLIGYNTAVAGAADTNEIVIGASATGLGSNTTVIGNSSTTQTYIAAGTLNAPQVNATNGLVVNKATIATSYSIPSGSNAMSAGPITVSSGVTVTVPSGSRWVVV